MLNYSYTKTYTKTRETIGSRQNMYDNLLFGTWLKSRRKELDLTREELAKRVGCSPIFIYKLEVEDRRPSKQIAAILARELQVPTHQVDTFIKFARQTDSSTSSNVASIKGI